MGCKQSTEVSAGGGIGGRKASSDKDQSNKNSVAVRSPPKYMTADPDLGWRNITDFVNGFPIGGFVMDFQNERSGHTVKRINIVDLSLNIAERASRLANKFGVAIPENDWQSSTNLLNNLSGYEKRGGDGGASEWDLSLDTYMNKLLKHFGCPKFGWKLKARVYSTKSLMKTSPNIFLTTDADAENNQGAGSSSSAKAVLAELAAVPEYLQLVQDKSENEFLLDIGEIAMNIAEQLLRLEKSENPTDDQPVGTKTFGWKRIEDHMMAPGSVPVGPNCSREQFKVPVVNIDGEAFVMCPEELIMNVASWVQETYLTAPAF